MVTQNIYSHIPPSLKQELFETIIASPDVKIERIISHGQATPAGEWLQQENSEWVILLCGKAGIRFEDDSAVVALNVGDYLNIPARARHRVEWTEEEAVTTWLAVHYTGDKVGSHA
jgi:cupin 2 domain-containing protein